MVELKSTGLETDTLQEIKTEIETSQTAKFPAVDNSTSSPLGQLNSIFADLYSKLQESLAAIITKQDPAAAVGDQLDNICTFTGTERHPAIKSQTSCSLFFSNAGTYNSGSLRAYPIGNETAIFENVSDVVVVTAPTTASNVLFRALDYGNIYLVSGAKGDPGTLSGIASPVAGWDGLNGSQALPAIGSAAETDSDLRVRRKIEIYNKGASSVNAIVADISSKVTGVISVDITENDTPTTDSTGVPPFSFETIIYGPAAANSDIAQVIFDNKSSGAGTYGNVSSSIRDSAGKLHTIKFSRPTTIPFGINISDFTYLNGTFLGNSTIRNALVSWASSSLYPGKNVNFSEVISVVQDVPGVLSVNTINLISGASLSNFTNISINPRQIAIITSSLNIQLTGSAGTI